MARGNEFLEGSWFPVFDGTRDDAGRAVKESKGERRKEAKKETKKKEKKKRG
ncbi:hypothetical protein LX36DRAFT_656773 [Colletotrichum falcatum]|nr:hypothetical protein LX36DRAFT_656773 [Colletotrichum falcatum]